MPFNTIAKVVVGRGSVIELYEWAANNMYSSTGCVGGTVVVIIDVRGQ